MKGGVRSMAYKKQLSFKCHCRVRATSAYAPIYTDNSYVDVAPLDPFTVYTTRNAQSGKDYGPRG